MKAIRNARGLLGLSQRRFSRMAGISFRELQKLEWGEANPRLSTLNKINAALGYSEHQLVRAISNCWTLPPDSIRSTSEHVAEDGEDSWKLWLFEFVDAFRASPSRALVEAPPALEITPRLRALFASTAETLCCEADIRAPWWCDGIPNLPDPWFVSGMESLKAIALAESPAQYRKRNIFVLANFLERA